MFPSCLGLLQGTPFSTPQPNLTRPDGAVQVPSTQGQASICEDPQGVGPTPWRAAQVMAIQSLKHLNQGQGGGWRDGWSRGGSVERLSGWRKGWIDVVSDKMDG